MAATAEKEHVTLQRRPASPVWLLYGVYLVLLGWLAFGSHAPDTEKMLISFGVRRLWERPFVVQESLFGQNFESLKVLSRYGPNYGGVLLYAVGGGLVAYYLNDRQRRAEGRTEQEDPVPRRSTQ
ncbi:hypothetical protein [Thermaerobacter subterraneus]|uniref:Uncharacterized protein n=1 Tax=Thermaerobacter subterraneus DSM 13965 TaxID=867903 RepID=K6Q0A3_9FIRM|nr:hypothetical protein [Thermaerobacter subterraneus]EKP94483.1 hypothetical protein ThesuDRAFT_02220 [Thermaerobacter subterraneus DSM 13965]